MGGANKIGLLLRINSKPFEAINALRTRFPATTIHSAKYDPSRQLLPYLSLFRGMPANLLSTYQERLSNLAPLRQSFTMQATPQLLAPRREGDGHSVGVKLPYEQIEQLRAEIYKEFKDEFRAEAERQGFADGGFKFEPRQSYHLMVRVGLDGLTKPDAEKILSELEGEYKGAVSTVVAEGLALQEAVSGKLMRVVDGRMKGEYPFSAAN